MAEPYSVRRVGDAWVIFGNGQPILATRNRRDAIQCAKRAAELASEASSQRGDSIVRAHSASEDARERAGDTRPEPGSSARAELLAESETRAKKKAEGPDPDEIK